MIQSNGDGDEKDFILLTAAWVSPAVISSKFLFLRVMVMASILAGRSPGHQRGI